MWLCDRTEHGEEHRSAISICLSNCSKCIRCSSLPPSHNGAYSGLLLSLLTSSSSLRKLINKIHQNETQILVFFSKISPIIVPCGSSDHPSLPPIIPHISRIICSRQESLDGFDPLLPGVSWANIFSFSLSVTFSPRSAQLTPLSFFYRVQATE